MVKAVSKSSQKESLGLEPSISGEIPFQTLFFEIHFSCSVRDTFGLGYELIYRWMSVVC